MGACGTLDINARLSVPLVRQYGPEGPCALEIQHKAS
jgi:hypothetical protein